MELNTEVARVKTQAELEFEARFSLIGDIQVAGSEDLLNSQSESHPSKARFMWKGSVPEILCFVDLEVYEGGRHFDKARIPQAKTRADALANTERRHIAKSFFNRGPKELFCKTGIGRPFAGWHMVYLGSKAEMYDFILRLKAETPDWNAEKSIEFICLDIEVTIREYFAQCKAEYIPEGATAVAMAKVHGYNPAVASNFYTPHVPMEHILRDRLRATAAAGPSSALRLPNLLNPEPTPGPASLSNSLNPEPRT